MSLSEFALRLVKTSVSHVHDFDEGFSNDDGVGVGVTASKSNVRLSEKDQDMSAHITGIFVHLDTDKDGLITRNQLAQGLQLIGLRPQEVLIKKFLVASANAEAKRLQAEEIAKNLEGVPKNTSTSGAGSSSSKNSTGNNTPSRLHTLLNAKKDILSQNQSQSAQEGQNSAAVPAYQKNKINANIFVSLALKEWKKGMENGLPHEVDSLFSFAVDDNASRTIARAAGTADPLLDDIDNETLNEEQIKHLLVDVHAPSRLNERDLKSFLSLLREKQKEKVDAQEKEKERLLLVKKLTSNALQNAKDRKRASSSGSGAGDNEIGEDGKGAQGGNEPISITIGELKKILYNMDLQE